MAKIKLELPKNANYADGYLLMTTECLSELVDSLQKAGVIQQHTATSQHLEDMRRIAFSQLDIDHAQGISAVKQGADIVLSAMRRSGQIASENIDNDTDDERAVNIEDHIGTVEDEESAIPDVIIARSDKMAEQYGLAVIDDDFLTPEVKDE